MFLSIISIVGDCGPLDLVQQTKIETKGTISLSSTINSIEEEIIARQIEGIKKMIRVHDYPEDEEGKEQPIGIPINPAMKRHFELEIKTLRDAPRDADKLRRLLQAKLREYEDTMKIEDLERIVTEMEMLRFVLCAVCRSRIEKR